MTVYLNTALQRRRSWSNFKPSNTVKLRTARANVLAGLSNAKVVYLGDSTWAGDGSGTGVNGWDGARALSPVRRVATSLNARGIIPAQEVGVLSRARWLRRCKSAARRRDNRSLAQDWKCWPEPGS